MPCAQLFGKVFGFLFRLPLAHIIENLVRVAHVAFSDRSNIEWRVVSYGDRHMRFDNFFALVFVDLKQAHLYQSF